MKGLIRRKIIYNAEDLQLEDDETIVSADTIGDNDVKIEIESTKYGKYLRCQDLHFNQKVATTTLIDKCRGVKLEVVCDFNELVSEAKIDIAQALLEANADIIQLLIDNNVNINKLLIDAGIDVETLLISAGLDVNKMLADAGIDGIV